MEQFVPTVSLLYFKDPTPPLPKKQASRDYTKVQCYSCRSSFEVRDGRCGRCGDLPDTWIDEIKPGAC